MTTQVRSAVPGDVATIAGFIRDLARYEKLEHELDFDEGRLHEHLFGSAPVVECLIGEVGGKPAGYALFLPGYSTFKTRPALHLEDLYVDPEHRGCGLGVKLLRAVAAVAAERECARFEWVVLDWNEPAIRFYERMGAELLPDWRTCRVAPLESIRSLADG